MAAILGDPVAEREYRADADKSKAAIFREFWNPQAGRLGSIGSDGIWWTHPQTWEEFLPSMPDCFLRQGRRAMR